jgi:hypothetical protein
VHDPHAAHARLAAAYSWPDVAARTVEVYDAVAAAPLPPLLEALRRWYGVGRVYGAVAVILLSLLYVFTQVLEAVDPAVDVERCPDLPRGCLEADALCAAAAAAAAAAAPEAVTGDGADGGGNDGCTERAAAAGDDAARTNRGGGACREKCSPAVRGGHLASSVVDGTGLPPPLDLQLQYDVLRVSAAATASGKRPPAPSAARCVEDAASPASRSPGLR